MTQLLVDRSPVDVSVDDTVVGAGAEPAARVLTAPARPRLTRSQATQSQYTQSQSARSQPVRRVRPGRTGRRGPGRIGGPTLRPSSFWAAPATARRAGPAARSCTPSPSPSLIATPVSYPTWRLTDRGVAVVLVIGLMIMVAALTVVGLTAMSVTGDGYQATVSASLPR
jgi:hypothetical protein